MAKGWSFGALTNALKSSAFIDTTAVAGDTIGNVMTVGFLGIGRTNNGIAASLDLSTYRWHVGECIYVGNATVTGLDADTASKLKFGSGDSLRFTCVAMADRVATLLVHNGTIFYMIHVNGNSTPFVFGVQQLIASTGSDSVNILQSSITIGSATLYPTLYFKNSGNSNLGYFQVDATNGSMYLCPYGGNRVVLQSDATMITPSRVVSQNGVSDFWGITAGEFYTQGKPGSRIAMSQQGLHLGWNEDGAPSSGATAFVNNQGGGSGGFRFRNVNANNSVQTAEWRMDGATGSFIASGNIYAVGLVYTGNGSSFMAQDGNIYGSVWGGYLNNFIAGQVNGLNNSINNVNSSLQSNAMATCGRGGQQYSASGAGGSGARAYEAPPGCYLSGINTNVADGRGMGVYFRQMIGQKVNGGLFGLGDLQ